jgi:hypothetical protein
MKLGLHQKSFYDFYNLGGHIKKQAYDANEWGRWFQNMAKDMIIRE